ncbi:lens fiber membrane intrinsic protein-like [Spea bombifrons]|uniref:lens fiber membrane intrinsic protein-like n=1 Tax=Spea bombifrons TaxID=233779 RepID=UPI00234AEEDF|nr:lens fiber membrane intrinsic protein-like [Spea bombifrons]
MNRPSKEVSFRLRVVLTSLVSLSNLFLLIALVSDQWIFGNKRNGILYLGIWRFCGAAICLAEPNGYYIKAVFIVCFIISFLVNVVAVLHFIYDFSTITNFKKSLGQVMLVMAFFEATGMINASIFFILSPFYESLAYAYFMGWIAVAMALAAGIVSYWHATVEPEIEEPPTIKDATGESPPPYSVMP